MIPQAIITAADAEDPITPSFTFQRVRNSVDVAELRQIMTLRYEVYCLECGFLSPEQFQYGLETDEYDANSAHFSAHNLHDEVVGSLRLVRPSVSQHFPFETHCKALFKDVALPRKEESGEISRLVVRKDYRRRTGDALTGIADRIEARRHSDRNGASSERRSTGPQILLGLYRELYQYSLQAGVRYWYAAMEKALARALARFEFVFTPIGPETDYYGLVTPYIADLRELEIRVGAKKPELMDWLRHGLPTSVKPDWH